MWSENGSEVSLYSNYDVTTLTWSLAIPTSGAWYIVFDNDSSVYGKQIRGSISHQSQTADMLLMFVLLGACFAVAMLLILAFRNIKKK